MKGDTPIWERQRGALRREREWKDALLKAVQHLVKDAPSGWYATEYTTNELFRTLLTFIHRPTWRQLSEGIFYDFMTDMEEELTQMGLVEIEPDKWVVEQPRRKVS